MKDFDIIIAGGGAAGLSMAYFLALDPAFDKQQVLVIDKGTKLQNDRTWCYWHDGKMPFDQLAHKTWQKIAFVGHQLNRVFDLPPMEYYMVKGIDFYRHTLGAIQKKPNIQLLQSEVLSIEPIKNGGAVHTADGKFVGKYVMDSLYQQTDFPIHANGHPLLLQHFKGWHIETEKAVFDPGVMQMFDFTIPQQNEVRFVYILPFTAHEAIVEFTIFSTGTLGKNDYDPVLEKYIEQNLQVTSYKVLHQEQGIIPMTTYPFPTQRSPNIINMGTKAGLCKPSTGYAFLRIQRDCQQILKNLKSGADINHGRVSPAKFQFYDALMLDIMERDGGSVSSIFEMIFSKNPIQRVLKFLDEKTTLSEDLQIMLSVPTFPFLLAILRLFGKKMKRLSVREK